VNEKIEKHKLPEDGIIYKPKEPFIARVLANRILTTPESTEDIRHVVFDFKRTRAKYLEGQSFGIIPPGLDEVGKPHKPRLYSVASARLGDDMSGDTFSLCVKRVVYTDPSSGREVRGVASNFICDLKVGDEVSCIGPSGRHFLLPEDDTNHLVMLGVGTGIAPYRAFVDYIYKDRRSWKGDIHLFFGARTEKEATYANAISRDLNQYSTQKNYHLVECLSRIDPSDPRKGYVQSHLPKHMNELWPILATGQFCLYICGLKGVEGGVVEALQKEVEAHGLAWDPWLKEKKAQGRWMIEVY
jgi:ferredoxin--NADP+ reductase